MNMIKIANKYDAVSEMLIEAAPPESEFYKEIRDDLMDYYGKMAEDISELSGLIALPLEKLTLRVGLCFRLLKKVIQAQEKVNLFDENKLEKYLMKIVIATFEY